MLRILQNVMLLSVLITVRLKLMDSLRILRNIERPFHSRRFGCDGMSNSKCPGTSDYVKVGQRTVYDGWRKVIAKEYTMPNGKVASFDIVSQGSPSVFVFPWDSATCTTTILREYSPGVERWMYGVVAGMVELSKHENPLQCAKFELEEEAQLHTEESNWISLLLSTDAAIPADKYSDNVFHQYLAMDCVKVLNPKPTDPDEHIEVFRNVDIKSVLEIIRRGEMSVTSSVTVFLALEKLRAIGLPVSRQ